MTEELPRRFEGASALQALLLKSGTLADVEDVAGAFLEAVKNNAPAQLVINALWEDEPTFESPDDARKLFSNLLGLYELIAGGGEVDLAEPRTFNKREKAVRPEPFAEAGPDDAFVEAAWRYFEDHPREHEKLVHQFDHREDALVAWLETHGLDDDAFVLGRQLVCDVFCMLELGGHRCAKVSEPRSGVLPAALATWVDEGLFEAEHHEEKPLPEATAAHLRALIMQAAGALFAHPGA